ncbi:MAG: hypothetical protein RLZ98_2903 [Pseudomonadota bacterium]
MLIESAISLVERTRLPDSMTRAGISFLVERSRRALAARPKSDGRRFCEEMEDYPIAVATRTANAQHYEVPAAFFELVLGARRKYSCCYFDRDGATLDDAEVRALELSAEHAGLEDGQRVLELGCGWGSMSLWMAQRYPGSRIVAVSNSHSQRNYIQQCAAAQGLTNLEVVTADMNNFAPEGRFDRVVSIEMFEHMSNWRRLIARICDWVEADGRCMIHVFSHRAQPYRFNVEDPADWIAQHFFTGGIMPSHDLMHQFPDLLEVEQDWRWSGEHYQKTADAWLANFDRNSQQIDAILHQVYGSEARVWKRRWRLFFLATRGLFGHTGGAEWGVSHYRLKPVRRS